MIPTESFVTQLTAIDRNLSVRWEYWKPNNKDGTFPIWPMRGNVMRKKLEQISSSGRFVIYGRSRSGRKYSIFDVVYPDGSYHPLDRRVFQRLLVRDGARGAWDNLDAGTRGAQAKEREVRMPTEAEGPMSDALEAHYRHTAGLKQYALGRPGIPATANSGHFLVNDKRRFANLVE